MNRALRMAAAAIVLIWPLTTPATVVGQTTTPATPTSEVDAAGAPGVTSGETTHHANPLTTGGEQAPAADASDAATPTGLQRVASLREPFELPPWPITLGGIGLLVVGLLSGWRLGRHLR